RCLRVLRCLPWAFLARPRGDRLRLARPRPRLPDQVRRRLGDAASADLTQQARVVLAGQCEKSKGAPQPPPRRHALFWRLNARNRVWLARRRLPWLLAGGYLATWTMITLTRLRSLA